LALYRPGPMESGMLDDFIERKHGRAKITYVFEALEPILKPTYGVIVYQEQVMQIVQTIGGFSLGGADLVRRAMGKKIKEEMDRLKSEFADGAVKNGHDRRKSEELFDLIVKFAGYGFNKSHSAAYAMITFQTAWLKAHYSQEFMAALLTSEQNNTDKIVQYTEELDRLNIKLLPPNIQKSMVEFTPIKTDSGEDAIMFGLGAIKGVGAAAVRVMLEEREKGAFKNLNDFISRIDTQKVNKKVIESLIKSGALDCFGYSRKALLEQMAIIIKASQDGSLQKKLAENSLFGTSEDILSMDIKIEKMDEYELKTILSLEKETIGFYISGHPLDEFKEQLKKIKYTLSSELDEIANGSKVIFIGKVEEIKTKISKKGNRFSILTLLDLHGNLEFTIFEKTMEKLEALGANELLAIYVEISKDSSGTSFRVLKVMNLQEAKKQKTDIIRINNENNQNELSINSNIDNSTDTKTKIGTEFDMDASCVTATMKSDMQMSNDEEIQHVFAQTEEISINFYETMENAKNSISILEIIVELSNDTLILDKISELSHMHKGSQRAKLTITYKEQKLKEIPLSFGVNDGFINELQKIDGVRLQR
ncbi:MAG: DNA polymerase III subunit alpha, partial [Campylobacteraceae bacterium]|nr:DNA polymerase III subunit alpha [Campylobacteraceae bacterium]